MGNHWKKVIAHVDMDAFFASVEQLLHPEWRGKPVIVGADPRGGKGRGVVAAASYEARKFGVHSALPISQAYRKCPNGIYVPPHGHVYQDYSRRVFAVLETFSPLIEPLSIDEAFLDLSGMGRLFPDVADMGREIKRRIKSATGLTASVGIAVSKSVAKIASDFDKPDGLTIVPPDEVQAFLDPLPVSALWGVGQKMLATLRQMGVRTVADLRRIPLSVLETKFGKMGIHVHKMARGEDQREVHPLDAVKSVSNERTFERDETDWQVVSDTTFALSEKVSGRLRRGGIRGRTVHLKIRFRDFKTFTRSYTLPAPTNLTDEIFRIVEMLLQEFDPLPMAVRLVGVGVSGLSAGEGEQLSLWEEDRRKKLALEKAMDRIQDKFGQDAIRHARGISGKAKK